MLESEKVDQWVDKARDTYDEARERATGWDQQVRDFTAEKPFAAILCALAAGYALARISTWR
jgi:hypothetical protein